MLLALIIFYAAAILLIETPCLFLIGKLMRVETMKFNRALQIVMAWLALNVGVGFLLGGKFIGLLMICVATHLIGTIWVAKTILRIRFARASLLVMLTIISVIITGVIPLRTFVMQAYRIPANSMRPTIMAGDRIIVSKFIYRAREPSRWEVAAFKYPADRRREFVKRIVGLPGETIELRDGSIMIDGKTATPPTELGAIRWDNAGDYARVNQSFQIPEPCYFVLGDNSQSHDSRYWGPVCRQDFLGKAVFIYWPLEHQRTIQ